MNDENTKYLCETYPQLYDMSKPLTESLMAFGFPGDGWFELIKDLSEKITATGIKIEVMQIKQKFGSLRYYFNFLDPDITTDKIKIINDLVQEAEEKSETICEGCGKPGLMRNINRWLYVQCDDCYNKQGENKTNV